MSELVVASFNTHWGLDPAGCPFDVVEAIGRVDADVIALQECWRPRRGEGYAADAARRHGYALVEGPFVGGPHGGVWRRLYSDYEEEATFGVALLSRFPVLTFDLVALGKAPFDMQRNLLVVDLDVGRRPMRVNATHLCMLPWGSLWQLAKLGWVLRGPADRPSVLAGDFNMWGPVVETLLPGWRRGAVGKTWPAHRPHSQIDHILVKGPLAPVDTMVLPPQGSDHRPIRVRLRID